MPEVDKAEQILRPLADAGNRQTAHDAWDVYENSKSKDEFISSINKIDLPDEYKQKLYDSKWPAPAAPPRSIPMKAGESYIAPKGPPTFKEEMYDFYNRAKDAIGLGPKKDPTLAAIDKNRVDPLDKPLIPIASFANQNPKTMGEGFMTGVMEGGEGITSPKNLALMFGMKGLAKAPGIAWQGISKASNAVFKTDMAKGIIDMIPEAKAALEAGDEALAGRLAGHMAVNLLFLTEDKVREKYGDMGVKIKKRLNKDIPSQVKTEAPPVKAKTAPPAKVIEAPKVEVAPEAPIAPVAPEVAPPVQVTEPVKMDPENAKSLLPEGFTLSRGKRPPNGVNASYPEGMTLDEISGKLDALVQSGAIKDWEVVGNKVRLNFNKETDGQKADQELVKPLEEPKHKFASTQVQLPKEIGDKLVEFGKSIPDEDLAEDGRETDPHITVKYGINSDNPKDIEKLKSELSKMPPVEVYLGKTSIFPSNEERASDVVKADIDSPGLHELNKIVSSSVPTTDTYQGYTPHATIAYVKPGLGEKYSGSDALLDSRAIIDNVEFRDKNGNKVVIPLQGRFPKIGNDPEEPNGKLNFLKPDEIKFIHGTTEAGKLAIESEGKFRTDAHRVYGDLEFGPSFYAAPEGSWWMDPEKAAAGRAVSYSQSIPVDIDKSAKILKIENFDDMVNLAHLAGFSNPKEFYNAIGTVEDQTHNSEGIPYNRELSKEESDYFSSERKRYDQIANTLKNNGIDGFYLSKESNLVGRHDFGLTEASGPQLVVTNPEAVRPAGIKSKTEGAKKQSYPSPPKPKSIAPPAPIKPQKSQPSRGIKYIDQFGDKQWLSDLKNGMAYLVDELGSLTVVPESELNKMQQVPEVPPSVSEPLKKKMSSVEGLSDIDLKSTNPANVIDGLRYRVYTGDKEKPSRVYLNNAALSLLAAFNGTPDADYLAGLHVTKEGVESIIDTARYNAKLHTGNERSRLYGLADALEKANGDKGLVVAYAGLKGDTKTVVRHELSHSLQRDMPAIFTDDFASRVSARSPHWLDVAMHYVGNYSRHEIIPELLADWNTGNYDLFKGETHSIDKQAVDEIVLDIVEELIKEYGAEQVEKSFKFAASGQREKASVAKVGGDGKNTKPPAKLSESARSTGGSIPGRR